MDLIRRIGFLKAAVVVSADPTNEPALVTEARKEAKRWNAVENFCKPFDFKNSDKQLTGIAFLIVCDMLLTGFDAPIEQVMYLDKKMLAQSAAEIGRASCRERVCQYVYISVADGSLEKKEQMSE